MAISTSSSSANEDVLDRLEAMRAQEDATHTTYNYLQFASKENGVDASARESMVTWLYQIQQALKLSPETVWLATSYLDRYLSSGKGRSQEALNDKYAFQLATMTSFYTAVKVNERNVQLSVATFAKLCKGYYAKKDILAMEEDLFFALDWRVSTPTPMEFVRHLMDLLPEKIANSETTTKTVIAACQKDLEHASTDIYFSFVKPSVLGASCLATALTKNDLLDTSERQDFWLHLARITDLIDVMETQNKLISGKPVCKPKKTVIPANSSLVAKVAQYKLTKTVTVASNEDSPAVSSTVSMQCSFDSDASHASPVGVDSLFVSHVPVLTQSGRPVPTIPSLSAKLAK